MEFKIKLPDVKKLKLFKNKKKKSAIRSKHQRRTKSKSKLKTRKQAIRISPNEKEGADMGKFVTGLWNLQSNPSKVYIGGKRIHHGLVGAVLTFLGAIENDEYVKGFGKALMKDDIKDLPQWLDFDEQQRY